MLKKVFIFIVIFLMGSGGFWLWKTDQLDRERIFSLNIFSQPAAHYDFPSVKGAENKLSPSRSNKGLFFPLVNVPLFPVPIKKDKATELKLPNAHAAAILDVDSGKVLFEKNGHQPRQIASLTKMLTAIIAVEKISNLSKEVVTIGDEIYIEGTKVGCPRSGYCIGNRLKKGEKIYALDLLKAMLMNSANDAATALGKHLGGSIEGFAKTMNEKADKLNLENSHFCTPSGLEIDGREKEGYSTAIDLARIAAYSMRYPIIWDILRIPGTDIYSVDKQQSHKIINTDRLLDQMPGCLGGKTGFTPLAGHSLMLGAQEKMGQHRIIIVVLDDPYRWQDVQRMAEWTWQNFEWK